jgi:hypothetical protein
MKRLRKTALEGVRSGRDDLDGNRLPYQACRAVEVDDPEVRRTA